MNKPCMRVEGACASGGLAFTSALESIRAGSDVCLVVGAEVQTTVSARQGGEYLARASHFKRQKDLDDFVFPALFARRIKHCSEAYGITADDLAMLSVKAYKNANKNPLAHMHAVKMDMETASSKGDKNPAFLANEEYKDFLKISDCSQVSDGGAALVLVSEEGLAKLGKSMADCTEVIGLGQATGNLYVDADPLTLGTTAAAANAAYAEAGVVPADVDVAEVSSGSLIQPSFNPPPTSNSNAPLDVAEVSRGSLIQPSSNFTSHLTLPLDVAEVHDCFTITELLMAEALGFAPVGEGKTAVREGRFEIDGDIPINTGGGLVGFGHPVGATGVKQLLEVHRQFKGQCGEYQVPGSPEVGVCANMGGDDKTAVVTVLKNCK